MATGQNQMALPDSQQIITKIPDNWFGCDKAKHFLLSAVITGAVSYYAQSDHGLNRQESQNIAVGLSLSLGVGKEFYDMQKPAGYFSWKDMVFDVLGIVVGVGVLSQW